MKQYTDPNELMKLPFVTRQFRWRLQLEIGQLVAKITYKPFANCIDAATVTCFLSNRGKEIEDTAVTTGQSEVLLAALKHTERINLPIAEVGAWRGATTAALAAATSRTIYAIDQRHERADAIHRSHAQPQDHGNR